MKARLALVALALISALLWFLPRYVHRHEALEPDLATYAVIANELLNGKTLYTEVFDNKPPGIFLSFAAAQALVGYHDGAVLLLNLLVSFLTGVAIVLALRVLKCSPWQSLFGFLLWSLFSLHAASLSNQPQTEAFINALQTLGLAFLLRSQRLRTLVGVGSAWALATFFKQTAILLILVTLVYFLADSRQSWIVRLKRCFALGLPMVTVWGTFFAFYALRGEALVAWQSVVSFGSEFARSPWLNLLKAFDISRSFRSHMYWGAPFLIGFVFLLVKDWRKDRNWAAGLLLVYIASRPLQVVMPGRWYPHYFQVYLPLFALAAVYLVHHATRYRYVVAALALSAGVYAAWPTLTLSSEQLSEYKYGSSDFNEIRKMSLENREYLRAHPFYTLGYYPAFYYYTQTRPRFGVLWGIQLSQETFRDRFAKQFTDDIERHGPYSLVILVQDPESLSRHPVRDYILKHHARAGTTQFSQKFKLYPLMGMGALAE